MSRMPKASDHMGKSSGQQNSLINSAMSNQNNPNLMGKTVVNTVYQNSSQMQNQSIYSTIQLQQSNSNSFNKNNNLNNNANSQVGNNNSIQNNLAKTDARILNTPNRLSAVETPKIDQIAKTQIPKGSKSKNMFINKDGKQISNIDLNDDTQGDDRKDNLALLANSAQSVYPSQNNKLPNVSQQIKEQPNTQQSLNNQSIYSTIQLTQNQSVHKSNNQSFQPNHQSQKGSTNAHQSIQQKNLAQTAPIPNNSNSKTMGQTALNTNKNANEKTVNAHSQLNKTTINPNKASRAPVQNSNANSASVHNQNQNASIKNQSSTSHNQSKNPSSSTYQSNPPVQQGSQIKGSHKEDQKQSNSNKVEEKHESNIMRKSSLKTSRNKSPPQVIKTPEGKIKGKEIDSNGNSYSIATDKETPDISSNLNKYLENEIKHSQLKESKPESPKKGNGFRYFGQLSKAGRNQNGQKKVNQDTPLVHLNVGGIGGFNLFGVLDGHGPHGHFVSHFCKEHFIKYMTNFAESCIQKKIKTPEAIHDELKNNKYADIYDIFNKADDEMSKQNQFDYNFSGTTCNIIFQFNKYLVCCSVGDSRGILVEDRGDSKNLGIVELSHDHKPDLPGEKQRIELNGGIVDRITDIFGEKVGPPRVWKAETNYPGLAMSRSLGDFQAKQCGVIATPEIIEYNLTRNSKYLIVCSDGVWEFIKNEQVRDLGNVYYNKNDVGGFCTDLVRFAVHSWEEFDIIRDDITVVCVYF